MAINKEPKNQQKTKAELNKGIEAALKLLEEFIVDADRVRVVQVGKVVAAVQILRILYFKKPEA